MEERAKRERTELDAEERQLRDIERLVKRARETGEDQVAEATELQRGEGDAPIKIGIGGGGGALGKARMKEGRAACGLFGDGDDEATAAPSGGGGGSSSGFGNGGPLASAAFGIGGGFGGGGSSSGGGGGGGGKARVSAAQQLMEEEERKRAKGAKSDSWLAEGIIVKVMNSSLRDGRYYKRKGTIERVVERYTMRRVSNKATRTRAAPHSCSPRRPSICYRYTAHVRAHDDGTLIKLDQEELETVIPSAGGAVLIVNGAHRGATAKMLSINVDAFTASVRIDGGAHAGRTLEVEYEEVSKLDREFVR